MPPKKRAKKKPAEPTHTDLGCFYTVERDASGELVLDWVCDRCEAKYKVEGLTARGFLGNEEYEKLNVETP